MRKFKMGDIVVYVPTHAEGNSGHPDCEEGFITSVDEEGKTAMVRFWSKSDGMRTLRTTANGERCDLANLEFRGFLSARGMNVLAERYSIAFY